jgi:hypothetical protein
MLVHYVRLRNAYMKCGTLLCTTQRSVNRIKEMLLPVIHEAVLFAFQMWGIGANYIEEVVSGSRHGVVLQHGVWAKD